MKTDLFQSCDHSWVFQICWHIECSTFTASSFTAIWLESWNSQPQPQDIQGRQPSPLPPPTMEVEPITNVLSHSVLSDSLHPHWLQPTRLLCPWVFFRQEYWGGLPCPPPGTPQPRDQTQVSHIAGGFYAVWATSHWLNQLCLCHWGFPGGRLHKKSNKKEKNWESFQVGEPEHFHVPQWMAPNSRRMEAPLSGTWLYLFIWLVISVC